jgi:effector-binding domain-containing protein
MIKIGDFSKLSQVSVKTLRYYSDIGLLIPAYIDQFTSNRYYAASQLLRLNRILALKDLGISLDQTKKLLSDGLPAEQMTKILHQHLVDLEQQIEVEMDKVKHLTVYLRQFEQEQNMSTLDIVIKSIPEIEVASYRGIAPTYPAQQILWKELDITLEQARIKPIGPCFTVDHDEEYKEADHDLEVCEPIPPGVTLTGKCEVKTLPAVKEMASLLHNGSFETLPDSYQKMIHWLDENKYQICGPSREVYIFTGEGLARQDDPSYLTEIQFPVKKAMK